jgi:hypothetical protein
MSHNLDIIASESQNVTSEITATIDYNQKLGHALNHSDGQTGAGSGNYANGDYYLFFTGADSYSGIASVSSDTITLPDGEFLIQCVPTFGEQTTTSANTEIFLQFHDKDDNPVGNMMPVNLDNVYPTYMSTGICTAYAVGPNTVKLKVMGTPTGNFPKNGTETGRSPFFLEIMRVK